MLMLSWKGRDVMARPDGDASAEAKLPPSVGIIMGSDSDLPTMAAAAEVLESFGITVEAGASTRPLLSST
jgi:NCAIR mutase (PurE)-related protein